MDSSEENIPPTEDSAKMRTGGVQPDPIPHENFFSVTGPNDEGCTTARFAAFNTTVELQAYGKPDVCRAALEAARNACRVYERLFSRTLPHSDVARLNTAAGARTEVDARTADLLRRALRYCSESGGVFDITVAPLVDLWDFRRGIAPSPDALAMAVKHVNWQNVEVSPPEAERPWARLHDPHAAVDLGGIAKGWIADRLTELFNAREIGGFVANLGGNVAVGGTKPDGTPWTVGVRDPRHPQHARYARILELTHGSAVTSGTYERCFMSEGVLFHHVLDPQTGQPANTDAAGVTVVADRSIDAEGFSTTLLALGTQRGLELARQHTELRRVVFVRTDGEVVEGS